MRIGGAVVDLTTIKPAQVQQACGPVAIGWLGRDLTGDLQLRPCLEMGSRCLLIVMQFAELFCGHCKMKVSAMSVAQLQNV
jgi:hypothetical protein